MEPDLDHRFDDPPPAWERRSAIQRAKELASARATAVALATVHTDENRHQRDGKLTFLAKYLKALRQSA